MLAVSQIILYSSCNKNHMILAHIYTEREEGNDWMGWSGVAQHGRAWCGIVQNGIGLYRVK